MHGLVNRSIQCFLRDTYGADLWQGVAADAALGFENFEALLIYEDHLTRRVLRAASARLHRPVESLLEDLGTYLISNAGFEGSRRLLRFCGESFIDFLHSLDDIQDRARLAIPDLILPELELRAHSACGFTLTCRFRHPGFGHVLLGILRAMADDYGALVLLHYLGGNYGVEKISIEVLDTGHGAGRSFSLGSAVA